MIQPTAPVRHRPILGAVAPPSEASLRRGNKAAAQIGPVVRCLKTPERLNLDRSMADHVEQLLVAPDIAFQRRDVEIADDDGRHPHRFRPLRHARKEIELLAELWIEIAVWNVSAGR